MPKLIRGEDINLNLPGWELEEANIVVALRDELDRLHDETGAVLEAITDKLSEAVRATASTALRTICETSCAFFRDEDVGGQGFDPSKLYVLFGEECGGAQLCLSLDEAVSQFIDETTDVGSDAGKAEARALRDKLFALAKLIDEAIKEEK